MVTTPADVLLQEFAQCADPDRAEALLEMLVVEHAGPGVDRIVRSKLAFQGSADARDVEDVSADVAAELIARLRGIKETGDVSLGNFSGYAAVSAYHACNEYLRRKYPNRHRLKTRLRYLLSTEKGLAIWEDGDADWLCGLPRWQSEKPAPVGKEKLAGWRDALHDVPRGKSGMHPADLARTIFERFGAPVPFDELVTVVAQVLAVEDTPNAPESAARDLGSGESDPAARSELKRWTAELWSQIRELPVAQRVALLLNLRAVGGQAAVALLPLTGVAGMRQIADALEMPAEELAAMWNSLPLDAPAIAERLGVTRQRVVNLRKSAVERLSHRP
jgi:hypothetical protein